MKSLLNKQNKFLLALILTVIIARFFPYREAYENFFKLRTFIDWGIAIIFLLYGLKLNLKNLFQDIKNWKLHLLVQGATFILFPAIVVLFYPFVRGTEYHLIWLAIFFLASLPSTVSSSVVMVSIAKGNVTSAIFNASVSGLIGIVATPLLMDFFMEHQSTGVNPLEVIKQLLLKVLLPIVIGVIFNPYFKNIIYKYGKWINEFDKFIILLIIYESFSKAFLENVFSSVPTTLFLVITVSGIALFFIIYKIVKMICKHLNFSKADTITATFCGSKKSLVHGSLFLMVLGISEADKVIFLLPIMLYHSFQLFYVSWLANKLGMR